MSRRLLCVSNRLPVILKTDGESPRVEPSSGGLVTALEPILRRRHGVWIGWVGNEAYAAPIPELETALAAYSASNGFDLTPVYLSHKEVEGFYRGFSNQIIWPLFHDLQTMCNFQPEYWEACEAVTDRFAEAVEKAVQPADLIWVHDYHLLRLGARLRQNAISNPCAFFLHTPFPPPDIFMKLPWRSEVIDALLEYDLIGVQTQRDLSNLLACAEIVLKAPVTKKKDIHFLKHPASGRRVRVGHFPIGIDFSEFSEPAQLPEIQNRAREIRREMGVDHIVLSVDRLDYTKGIPYRIRAFRRMLERFPHMRRKVAFMQVVVPSREEVPEYQTLKAEIEQAVTQLNGVLAEPGWTPMQHFFRSVSRAELIALYLAANVAFVTPFKDGMNLVAKEFCAVHNDEDGVLVLSEFAGAAEQLGDNALLVNPYHVDGAADALMRALEMPSVERQMRMRSLRDNVRGEDVMWWASSFLHHAGVHLAIPGNGSVWRRFTGFLSASNDE